MNTETIGNADTLMSAQAAIFDRALRILAGSENVLSVVAIGSYARGEQDIFSDIDLLCYLKDDERTGWKELYDQIRALHPVLWHGWLYDCNALFLFENGVRLDVDFLQPSDIGKINEIPSEKNILFDPDGVLKDKVIVEKTHKSAEHPAWFEVGDPFFIQWFFWMFRQAVCWAKRSQQGGKNAYDKLANAVDSLTQIRTRLIEMRLWTIGGWHFLKEADLAFAAQLALTYPRFTPEEVIQCAHRLLEAYEYAGPLYCEKAGASYPADKVNVLKRLLSAFESVDA